MGTLYRVMNSCPPPFPAHYRFVRQRIKDYVEIYYTGLAPAAADPTYHGHDVRKAASSVSSLEINWKSILTLLTHTGSIFSVLLGTVA